MFVSVSDRYDPIPELTGAKTNLWVTSSYDPTSHFESASEDVLEVY